MATYTATQFDYGRGPQGSTTWDSKSEESSGQSGYNMPAQGAYYNKYSGASQWGQFTFYVTGLNINNITISDVSYKITFVDGGRDGNKPIHLYFMKARANVTYASQNVNMDNYKPTVKTVAAYNSTKTLSWNSTEDVAKFVRGWKDEQTFTGETDRIRCSFYNGETGLAYGDLNNGKEYSYGYCRMSNCVLSFTYTEGGVIKYYTSSSWKNCQPYYYTGSAWVPVEPYYYTGSEWKKTTI